MSVRWPRTWPAASTSVRRLQSSEPRPSRGPCRGRSSGSPSPRRRGRRRMRGPRRRRLISRSTRDRRMWRGRRCRRRSRGRGSGCWRRTTARPSQREPRHRKFACRTQGQHLNRSVSPLPCSARGCEAQLCGVIIWVDVRGLVIGYLNFDIDSAMYSQCSENTPCWKCKECKLNGSLFSCWHLSEVYQWS